MSRFLSEVIKQLTAVDQVEVLKLLFHSFLSKMFRNPEHKPKGELIRSEVYKERLLDAILYWETDLQLKFGQDVLKSQVYLVKDLFNSRWQIELNPNYLVQHPHGEERYLSVWINLLSSTTDEMTVGAHICIMEDCSNPRGTVYEKSVSMVQLNQNCRKFGFEKYIPLFRLPSDFSKRLLFRISIQVFMDARLAKSTDCFFQSTYHNEVGPPNLDAFVKFGSELLHVDSSRLSACSPAFKAHFDVAKFLPMDLSQYLNSITALKFIIQFCHQGRVDAPLTKPTGLIRIIKAARELQIDELKEKCEELFLQKLSVSTFFDALELTMNDIIDYNKAVPKLREFLIENYEQLETEDAFRQSFKYNKEFYSRIMFHDALMMRQTAVEDMISASDSNGDNGDDGLDILELDKNDAYDFYH